MTDERNMALVCNALDGNIRVIDRKGCKKIEIYNEYGVGVVLDNLPTETFKAFVEVYGRVTE